MESADSHSATLSPPPRAASSPSLVEPPSSHLKRKSTPSFKRKASSARSSYKRRYKAKTPESDIKPETSVSTIPTPLTPIALRVVTPPTTPIRPQPTSAIVALTSRGVLLADDSKNMLSINRFKGIAPELHAVNRGPLNLRFPGVDDPEHFVISGLLHSHDMSIVKEVRKTRFLVSSLTPADR
jgi:hypothetical protein